MSVRYLEPRVEFDAGTRVARAEFTLRNDSAETWRAAEGFRVGFHLFDSASGTLIVDGARVALEGDLAPGGDFHRHLVGGAADAAGLCLEPRLHIIDGLMERL